MQNSNTDRKLAVAAVVAAALVWMVAAQVPDRFTNLKVLPADVGKQQLVDTMKGFRYAMGTNCAHCHEGEGDDLSVYDFASDARPAKEVARRHMRMTRQINDEYFEGQATVTCMSCHQGEAKPSN